MVKHHAVSFTTYAGLLITAEGSMSGIGMVAVDPHAPGLDAAPKPMAAVDITGPQASAEPVERVIRDFKRVRFIFKSGDGNHRAEYFLLEDSHAVVALEDGGLHIVAPV